MRHAMIYRHIFIVRSVLETIRREVRQARWRETGGALVGYVSDDGAVVATSASGPGKRARRRRNSVLIDGVHAQTFCDAIYKESGGCFDYVGDWHRHPGQSLGASVRDREAMRIVAESASCPLHHPISLIYRNRREALAVYTLNNDGDLIPTHATIIDDIPL